MHLSLVPVQSVLPREGGESTLSCTLVTYVGLLESVCLANMLFHVMRTLEEPIATFPCTRESVLAITLPARRFRFRRRDEGSVEQRRSKIGALRRGCVNVVRHVERLVSQFWRQ